MGSPFEISEEQMRKLGYRVIDQLVNHLSNLRDKSPVMTANRSDLETRFDKTIPWQAEPVEKVFQHVFEDILTTTNYLNHPKFLAYVPSPSNYVSVLADTLATGYNIFTGGWAIGSAPAEVEIQTINWLLELVGFPVHRGGGTFTSGGSMANLTCMVTAKNIKLGDEIGKGVLYFSEQTHSSVRKGARIIGFTEQQLRIIPATESFQIDLHYLETQIKKDIKDGYQPFCIIGNAGTTNTGTIDPLDTLADIAQQHDLWFHIDGAYGGAAVLSAEAKKQMKGIERADSITIDPHKWLFQPYEIGCVLIRNYTWLARTFREIPEYLRDMEGQEKEINFHELGLQLTRRFRSLKLYVSMKSFGVNAFTDAVDYCIALVSELQDYLQQNPRWQIVSKASLGVICFRYVPKDESINIDTLNKTISRKLLNSGEAAVLTTVLNDQLVLRICVTNPSTTIDDLIGIVDELAGYAGEVT